MRNPKSNWFERLVRARRDLKPRPPESHLISTWSAPGSNRALPLSSAALHTSDSVPYDTRSTEDCANEPGLFLPVNVCHGRTVLVGLLIYLFASPAYSAVKQLESI